MASIDIVQSHPLHRAYFDHYSSAALAHIRGHVCVCIVDGSALAYVVSNTEMCEYDML